ncbi:unnamed protein product [Paramecium sonneborni]|uniref:RING-type domain-containing protein n=1 Tax=Paramecium sonneborni TaxID=65129 RepID=A0A8S1LAM0_9CILI|nr:unnamed protein product [Paramecium sonneborni]
MSNIENSNIVDNLENFNEPNSDAEFDFDNLEIPQLVRRNGTIQQENIQGYLILDKISDKIFQEQFCPICLCEDEQLYPLFCGHSFCENDINSLLSESQIRQNIVSCPICRQYQQIDSFKQLQELKFTSMSTVQKENNLTY